MNSIRNMVDVNTIIGEPIEASNETIIIPVSKVGFGFVAGGSEFTTETLNEYTKRDKDEQIQYKLPFGGGSGAGVSISPIAFLIIQGESVKLLHVDNNSPLDKLLDYVPDLVDKVNNIVNQKMNTNKDEEIKKSSEVKIHQKKKKDMENLEDEIGKIYE